MNDRKVTAVPIHYVQTTLLRSGCIRRARRTKRLPLNPEFMGTVDVWSIIVDFVGIVHAVFNDLPLVHRNFAIACRQRRPWHTLDFEGIFQSYHPNFPVAKRARLPPKLDWNRFVRFMVRKGAVQGTTRVVCDGCAAHALP